MRSEEVNRRHQHQPRKHAAREHRPRHARPDDVPDPQILRHRIDADRRALQNMLPPQVRLIIRRIRPHPKNAAVLEQRVQRAQSQPQKHTARKRSAPLPGQQHIRACRAFGIRQGPVLLHNQLPPQRDHEQHAQPAAQHRQHKNPEVLQIESQKDQRRQREDHAGSNRLPGVSRRLDNVVLENRGAPQRPQHADRQHCDRDRRRHRQPRLEPDIHRHRAKQQPENAPQDNRAKRQLRPRLTRSHKRPKTLWTMRRCQWIGLQPISGKPECISRKRETARCFGQVCLAHAHPTEDCQSGLKFAANYPWCRRFGRTRNAGN